MQRCGDSRDNTTFPTSAGERGQHHLSNLCYANSLHAGAQDLFMPIPEWIMPDLKQSILQTVPEWAGSMTYYGSSCPLMVTETESPVGSCPGAHLKSPCLPERRQKYCRLKPSVWGPHFSYMPHGAEKQVMRYDTVFLLSSWICLLGGNNLQWHVTTTWRCKTINIVMIHKSQNKSSLFLLEATKIHRKKNPKNKESLILWRR